MRTQTLTKWHLINLLVELTFDVAIVKTFGARPLIYLIMSSFFAGSLHPCAGHFIAEHYLWDGLEQETYSYYGPLNVLAYNVRVEANLLISGINISFRLDITMNIMISLPFPGPAFLHSVPSHQSSMTQSLRTLVGQWSLSILSGTAKQECSLGPRGWLRVLRQSK